METEDRTAMLARATAWAHRVFMAADANGDGTLTKSEVKRYFKTNPTDKQQLLGVDFKWAHFWGEIDEDGNGSLDVTEFAHFATKVCERRSSTVGVERQVDESAARFGGAAKDADIEQSYG
jgi:Ca2+-binding EF-hand superfamily protein